MSESAILTISTSDSLIRKEVVVINYSQGFTMTMDQAEVRSQRHNYPIQARENDFQFTIQCRSVEEFEKLVEDIRASQVASIEDTKGTVQISIPQLSIDYIGYATTLAAGARRFEIAPALPISLVLIKDNINIKTVSYSTLTGKWEDVLGSSVFDAYNDKYITRLYDSALKDRPPAGGGRRMLII